MPFQPGNTEGSKSRRAKPYADALRMEAAALAALEPGAELAKHPRGSLRAIAQVRLVRACDADGHADSKEIADRLDGKVPQAIVGDDEHPGVGLEVIQRTIVDAAHPVGDTNSEGVQASPGAKPV